MQKTNTACALCALPVTSHALSDNNRVFCCPGCHAVFNILQAKGELTDFHNNPIFKQAVHSGMISNAALLEQLQEHASELPKEEPLRLQLEITDLWCPSCAEVVRWAALKHRGVVHCVVDYCTDLAVIEYLPKQTSKEEILEAIRAFGYHPQRLDGSAHSKISSWLYLRFFVAAFCALNSMMLSYPLYASYFTEEWQGWTQLFAWLAGALATPVLLFSAGPLYKRAFYAARIGTFGMEALVTMAISAAYLYSVVILLGGGIHVYFDSLSVVVAFVLLGKIIEGRAKYFAKESLFQLTRSRIRRVRKQLNEREEIYILIKDVALGDYLIARTGETIAVEGVVVAGQASVNTSSMTGEALPVHKEVGSEVLSGTTVVQGRIVYRATATEETSLLQQIFAAIEQDLGYKAVYVRAADKVAQYFVPFVLCLAFTTASWLLALGYGWETALLRMTALLLISCPCAIGIAAPLVESIGLNRLASRGIIVRNRGCLHFLGQEDYLLFDKTGTVTEGQFQVLDGIQSLSTEHKCVLKGLSAHSIHPISQAVCAAINERSFSLDAVEECPGKGLRGQLESQQYILGSANFMRQQQISLPVSSANALDPTCTSVFFAKNFSVLSTIVLGDSVKTDIPQVLQDLRPYVATWLVSGDASVTVAATAKLCGFSHWVGECSPLEKRSLVEFLKKKEKIVAMVGDGINDAPALTAAHIGISVASAADMSIQVSDVLLASPSLKDLPLLLKVGVISRRLIKQNLAWSFSYNILGIGLAINGSLTPLFAAGAMILSSLAVIANSLRLRRY